MTKSTSVTSITIVDEIREKGLKEIFTLLDSDHDGHISTDKIEISELSNDAIDLLTGVFMTIEE